MNPATVQAFIDSIIVKETDKYTNHPKDKGGPTKYGITLKTLSAWRGKPTTAEDVEHLQEAEARAIYEKEYITGPRFDMINRPETAGFLVDFGVTSGPSDAVKAVQRVMNAVGVPLKVDGIMGPKTAGAINEYTAPKELLNRLVAERVIFHVDDTQKRPDQLVFLEGWVRRALSFLIY
jgi:lysozyme family protein